MKKNHNDIDNLTRELLSKSLLKPASSDFDVKLMDKILLTPVPGKLKFNGNSIRKAWLFLWISVIFMIVSISIISEFSGDYFQEISQLFRVTFTYMLYGGLVLFVPLILYQFDSMLQLMFWKKNKSVPTA